MSDDRNTLAEWAGSFALPIQQMSSLADSLLTPEQREADRLYEEEIWRLYYEEMDRSDAEELAAGLTRLHASVRMTDAEALAHARDLGRTRIEPGADPRAEWVGKADVRAHWRLSDTGRVLRDPRMFPRFYAEFGEYDAPVFDTLRESARTRPGVSRYVPFDVARWRDPEHRAAMVERARAYAALQPRGRR